MVKIHGIVYLIIGAVILFYTNYIQNKIGSGKLKFFIWAGYIFLIIGIAKIVIWFITRKKESGKGIRQPRIKPHKAYQQQRTAKYCFNCGASLRGNESFCYGCGQRLR